LLFGAWHQNMRGEAEKLQMKERKWNLLGISNDLTFGVLV